VASILPVSLFGPSQLKLPYSKVLARLGKDQLRDLLPMRREGVPVGLQLREFAQAFGDDLLLRGLGCRAKPAGGSL